MALVVKRRIVFIIALSSFCLGYLACLISNLRQVEYGSLPPWASETNWSFLKLAESVKLNEKINSAIQDKQETVRCVLVPSPGGPKLYFYNTRGMWPVHNDVTLTAVHLCQEYADSRNAADRQSGKLRQMFK